MYPFYYMAFVMVNFAIIDIYLGGSDKKSINKWVEYYIFIGLCILLIYFAGSRGIGTGYDDLQYRYAFSDIATKSTSIDLNKIVSLFRYEPITTLIMYVVSIFTKDAGVFLLVYAAITITINAISYKKVSPLIILSLAVYSSHLYINKDLNQIRFGLASALFVLSVIYYSERKYFISIIIFILAFLSHQTAFAGVLVLFSGVIRKRYTPLYIVLVSFVFGVIGSKVLLGGAINLIPQSALSYEGTVYDTVLPVFSISNIKNLIFVYLYCTYLIKDDAREQKDNIKYVLIFCFAVGAGVRIFFSDFSIIGGRVGNLFLQVEPILIAMLCYSFVKNKIISVAISIFVILFYIYYNTILNPQSVHGYVFDDVLGIFG